MTRKTAISLPDELYRAIERARRRAGKDRSTWIQEAASEYLKKRTKEADEEAWLAAYETVPLTPDEKSLNAWLERTAPERLAAAPPDAELLAPTRRRRRAR
jgi:metal-responsive CopG/Arc/MetJ family transcriptional regulator